MPLERFSKPIAEPYTETAFNYFLWWLQLLPLGLPCHLGGAQASM